MVDVVIINEVLFPRTPYGAAWGMLQYVEDIEAMGQYNWAEAVRRVVVDTQLRTHRRSFTSSETCVANALEFMAIDEFGYYVDDGEVVEWERRLKGSDNGHAGEMEPPNQDLSASKIACLGDVSITARETPNVVGVVEDGPQRCQDGVNDAVDVHREVTHAVSGDSSDGDKDFHSSIIDELQLGQHANSQACTP
ncbi:hypothetical protein Cgig2_030569 [Carnegiea gigantea]|uniref:Uncharacterized protein n=1 Tax=Carnegiea gigantea TaxID=171969 RepID=A0A9Q1GLJ1_9CARY|nr:hypothetical protein Cgig2_030569 [Carnegiea gigantea]